MRKHLTFTPAFLLFPFFLLAFSSPEINIVVTGTNALTNTFIKSRADTTPVLMDAAQVAPSLYQVLKDSMGIRVLNVYYKPGDSSGLHSHPDNVLYVINGGRAEFTESDGSKYVKDLKTGMTMILPGGSHRVRNIGTSIMKAILVEVNRPDTAGSIQDAAMDAVKVAPNLYKVVADSMNIRVLIATYRPGASSAMHVHPDNAIYVIDPGRAEFKLENGSKQTMDMKRAMVSIMPAGAHSVKNTGSTTTRVLIVEVNRAQ